MKSIVFASFLLAMLSGGFSACSDSAPPSNTPLVKAEKPGGVVDFQVIDDNVQHDTLLIQVTFDLGDGKSLMVASNVEEQLPLHPFRERNPAH